MDCGDMPNTKLNMYVLLQSSLRHINFRKIKKSPVFFSSFVGDLFH